ncbi:putative PAN/Apple domain-containing protein [Dioscorea sansibarensis]
MEAMKLFKSRASWQSFEYPTNTWLKDMKLLSKSKMSFTSWKDATDASVGDHSFTLDPEGLQEMVVRQGSVTKSRSGGCVRKTGLDCDNGSSSDWFLNVGNMKPPDSLNNLAVVDRGLSFQECRHVCLTNCSCVAFASEQD